MFDANLSLKYISTEYINEHFCHDSGIQLINVIIIILACQKLTKFSLD